MEIILFFRVLILFLASACLTAYNMPKVTLP